MERKKFTVLESTCVPLPLANIDTDQIIPARFLTATTREGFGENLFRDWRYNKDGSPVKDFVLNMPDFNGEILVAGSNFGCGSSREHAVWALQDYGFSVIIAPSFADIFYSNCFKNGVLPIKVDEKTIEKLNGEYLELEVDLEKQFLITNNQKIHFDIDPYQKKILLEGLDDIALTLQFEEKISEFEKKSKIPSVL